MDLKRLRRRLAVVVVLAGLTACGTQQRLQDEALNRSMPTQSSAGATSERGIAAGATRPPLDPVLEARILALDPEHITAADVTQVLVHAPAPAIMAFQGSLPFLTLRPFAEFLIAMGYPEASLHNPADGELSYTSRDDSARLAGIIARRYERDGVMPMLVGHSQGGMLVLRILHELAGGFHSEIAVRDPATGADLGRSTIVDPLTGERRPVIGLRVGYAAAVATGKLPRILLGQWDMIPRLREIPETVEEFTGFTIPWDAIAGTVGSGEAYRAVGNAAVRNVILPGAVSHMGAMQLAPLAADPASREWIEAYKPGGTAMPAQFGDREATAARVDRRNIIQAAELWFHIKKHWCITAQRSIRARRGPVALDARGR